MSKRGTAGTDIVVSRLGKARDLLAQAKTAPEYKRIADMAHAAKIFAQRQGMSKHLVAEAHEIEIDSLAGLGRILKREPRATGGQPYHPTRSTKEQVGKALVPTRADLGITRKQSMQAQRLDDIRVEKPAEFEAVRRGEKTPQQIHREERKAKAHAEVKAAEKIKGKYRVLYADCPWKYADAGYGHGPAEFHYPTMSVGKLCALPVESIALKNSVLFFWVPSPLLEDAFPVIKAWGFKYRASFVWDKVKHNVGHYNSVRHEFLLICTRGSCTPDDSRLIDSVQTIERGRHSEKPEKFRKIIDQMYPHGRRIELFARKRVKGWDAWGNQA